MSKMKGENVKYSQFYLSNNEGKSNCVIRTFCKIFQEKYESVYIDLCLIAKRLGFSSFNDVQVFEAYMEQHDTILINYGNGVKIKDLNLNAGTYAVFCWDKKEFYHMVPIIDNILYDKNDESLELYTISIYKKIK